MRLNTMFAPYFVTVPSDVDRGDWEANGETCGEGGRGEEDGRTFDSTSI